MPFWKREQLTPEEEASRAAVKAAESALKQAESAHEQAVKDAQKQINKTRKDYESAIKSATKRVTQANERKKLGSFANVTLFEDWIKTPEGEGALVPEVTALCDTAGGIERSSRVTATRLLTVGIFAFAFKKKKTHDNRELYLVVDHPDFVSMQSVDPKQGNNARTFAAKIVTAARQVQAALEKKEQEIARANEALKLAKGNVGGNEAAEAELARVTADTELIEQRRTELSEVTPTLAAV